MPGLVSHMLSMVDSDHLCIVMTGNMQLWLVDLST